jgi:hypothetical protein
MDEVLAELPPGGGIEQDGFQCLGDAALHTVLRQRVM